MTSLQIEYFLKVAECMSFSRAAKELFVSQPSVSRQIKSLESELGHCLFDRSHKNALRLTAAGMVFEKAFRQCHQALESAKDAARQFGSQQKLRLRVGVGEYWDLSDSLSEFRKLVLTRYPNAILTFESNDFRPLRQQIRSGDQDVILCTKTSLMDFEGLDVMEITNLESKAYVRKGLLCPEEQPLQAKHFEGQKLLMLSPEESPMAMELALLQFQARQIHVTPVYLPNRDTILQAVLMGNGITVFDQYMRFENDPRLTWFNLQDDIPVCAVCRQGDQNPLIKMLVDFMIQQMSDKRMT